MSRYLAAREDPRDTKQTVTPRVAVDLAEDLRRSADALRSGCVGELTDEQRARCAAAADAAADAFGDLEPARSAADRDV